MTLSIVDLIMIFSKMTFSIMDLIVTLNINNVHQNNSQQKHFHFHVIMLCHYIECHYAQYHCAECNSADCYPECHYAQYHYALCHAECRIFLLPCLISFMLRVIRVIMLNAIMLSVLSAGKHTTSGHSAQQYKTPHST